MRNEAYKNNKNLQFFLVMMLFYRSSKENNVSEEDTLIFKARKVFVFLEDESHFHLEISKTFYIFDLCSVSLKYNDKLREIRR